MLALPRMAHGGAVTDDLTVRVNQMMLPGTGADGRISNEELIVGPADVTPDAFATLDTSGGGWLNAAESTADVIPDYGVAGRSRRGRLRLTGEGALRR